MSSSRERLAVIGPVLTRFNPPGLDALSYRGATYENALARMLARLQVESVAPGQDLQPPLAHLNIEADDDWAVALLHAWAAVTDVLSFYQERIINEGYLRTATERHSVLELARSIGYELRPGLAASTYLAFTVQAARDKPPRQVDIPANTAVQGMPPTGQLPQIFETSQAFTARSEWNCLRLAGEDRPGTVWPGTTFIRLAGGRVHLQAGDLMLIVGDDGATTDPKRRWLLVTLSQVQADPQKGYTLVSWEQPTSTPAVVSALHNARLFSLKPLGGLFAYTQAGVDYRPAADGHWWPAGIGLPQTDVHALVCSADGHLFAGTKQDVFRSVDNGASWQPAPTGPLRKNVTALALDAGGPLYAGTDEGGIYRSLDQGRHWKAMSGEAVVPPPKRLKKWLPFLFGAPLPKTTVRCLAIEARRRQRVLVAGTDDGVFRSTDQGKTWQPSSFDLPGLDWKTGRTKTPVWALAVARRGWRRHLFAGTEGGVFRVKRSPRVWPLMIVSLILLFFLRAWSGQTSVVMALIGWIKDMLAGIGAFLSDQEGLPGALQDILKPINDSINGLTGAGPDWPEPWDVLNGPLTFSIDFLLVAAAVSLSFFIVKIADRFVSGRPRRCIGLPVHALAADANGRLFAGTKRGVYRSYGPTPRRNGSWLVRLLSRLKTRLLQNFIWDWRLVTEDETVPDVRALAVEPSGAVLAGTAAGELFRSDEDGEGWDRPTHHPKLADVQAIWAAEHGQFAAGTPVSNKSERRWALSQIEDWLIDLAQGVAGIPAQSWVVLQRGEDPGQAMLYHVGQASFTNSRDFGQVGQFTRLAVDDATDLEGFDRETAAVWVGDKALAWYDDRPVSGDTFILDRVVPGLVAAQRLIFQGKRPRVQATELGGHLTMQSADGLQSVPLSVGEVLHLMSPQPVAPAAQRIVPWHLRNRHGFIGFVSAPSDAFVLLPAGEDDETAAELALVKSVDHGLQATRITVCAPLKNGYDRSSLTIYGNVIPATHGQTVRDEVLGSGDGAYANQKFRLRQRALTFLSVPTAAGAEAILAVQVNAVTWHQVPFLYGLTRDSRVYIVRQDARGNTSIIFGDGEHGARLPSGHEQVTATYRIGLGPEANLPAGRLNQLQTALPGIESATNPLSATGGVGPEKLTRARQNAPLAVRAMTRIVSLADFEDFVRRFAGVGKAQARLLHVGPRDLLHITIADDEGQPISKTSDLYHVLVQAIGENRATSQPQVYVDSYEPVYFNLRAKIRIDPDHRRRQQDIEAAVRGKISQSFTFDAREFAQDVSASELISLMQDIPGVVAVQLALLHRSTQIAGLAQVVEAKPARWYEGRLLAAEMLRVNAQTGITLETEVSA